LSGVVRRSHAAALHVRLAAAAAVLAAAAAAEAAAAAIRQFID